MAIFNCYLSSPEGIMQSNYPTYDRFLRPKSWSSDGITWGLEMDFQPPNFTIEPTILTILFLNGTIQ